VNSDDAMQVVLGGHPAFFTSSIYRIIIRDLNHSMAFDSEGHPVGADPCARRVPQNGNHVPIAEGDAICTNSALF